MLVITFISKLCSRTSKGVSGGACWQSWTPIYNRQDSHKISLNKTLNLELGLITNQFHEFQWFTICRRTCRNNIESVPKVYKKSNNTNTRHEPRGRRPMYQANQGPTRWRTRPNLDQTSSNWGHTSTRPLKKPKYTTNFWPNCTNNFLMQ
jgi:hypothetical protein